MPRDRKSWSLTKTCLPASEVTMLASLREADERSLLVKDIDCLESDNAG